MIIWQAVPAKEYKRGFAFCASVLWKQEILIIYLFIKHILI